MRSIKNKGQSPADQGVNRPIAGPDSHDTSAINDESDRQLEMKATIKRLIDKNIDVLRELGDD